MIFAGARRQAARYKAVALLWLRADGKRFARAVMAAEAVWWALQLAMPWPTFAVSHIYDLMARLAPEWVWAALFAADAILLVRGFTGRRGLRVHSASLDCLTHGVVVTSALVSAPAGTGVGTQAIFLACSLVLLEWEAMDA